MIFRVAGLRHFAVRCFQRRGQRFFITAKHRNRRNAAGRVAQDDQAKVPGGCGRGDNPAIAVRFKPFA